MVRDLSEVETRKQYIDKELDKRGWLKRYRLDEVNSVKSNFKNFDYKLATGNIEKGVDRFIDYLLVDEDMSPLAIIEAKKYSVNKEKGRIQARTYQADIEKQIGDKIPVFLTNGHSWKIIDEYGERVVSGPFTQDDLRNRRRLRNDYKKPTSIKINSKIVDRLRSVSNVQLLAEHFSKRKRAALIQMATGTGKTRVAMALIDVLLRANMVRKVLFVADRTALADQASSDGFKRFFKGESIVDLRDEKKFVDKTGTFYVSTVQTLMGGSNKLFEKFSPGFFDLIVFDESHRSIYDRNKAVFTYFDAIKVGLTATPTEYEGHDTYELFDCEYQKPTVEYDYDTAVRDGVLVKYKAFAIDTDVLRKGVKGSKLSSRLKDKIRRQNVDPKGLQLTGSEFARLFKDNKTNDLIVKYFIEHCYTSEDDLPCKTIFFCYNQEHADDIKDAFERVFPHLSSHVQVITSDKYRVSDEINRFKSYSEPRIAISVGMLDTGVDIPEVCNLVFIKPVHSHVRFWQMFGRGTRNLKSCKHPEWLPNREKNDFLIFDFMIGGFNNIEENKLKSSSGSKKLSVGTRIFLNRINLLENPKIDDKQKRLIDEKVFNTISLLDKDSFLVREKRPLIKKLEGNRFNLHEYIDELRNEISPLIISLAGVNQYVNSFILTVERLFNYLLDFNIEKINKIRGYVEEKVKNVLRKPLSEVARNRKNLMSVLQDKFWADLSFDSVEFLVKVIAPLIQYYEPEKGVLLQIDAPDTVLNVKELEMKVKEDEELNKFINNNHLIKKIKAGKGITGKELLKIEAELVKLNPALSISNIQTYQRIDFLLFLKRMIGLSAEYDPKVLIEQAFDKFILGNNNHFNSRQLKYLSLLKKVFANRKQLKLKDFAQPPLSDQLTPDLFTIEELDGLVAACNKITFR